MQVNETKTNFTVVHPDYLWEFHKRRSWQVTRFESALRPSSHLLKSIHIVYGVWTGDGTQVVYVSDHTREPGAVSMPPPKVETREIAGGLRVQTHTESDHFYFTRGFEFFTSRPYVHCQFIARKKPVGTRSFTEFCLPVIEFSSRLDDPAREGHGLHFGGADLGDGFEMPAWRVLSNHLEDWGLALFTCGKQEVESIRLRNRSLVFCHRQRSQALSPGRSAAIGGDADQISNIEMNDFYLMPYEKRRWNRDRKLIESFCMREISIDPWVATYSDTVHRGALPSDTKRILVAPDIVDVRRLTIPMGIPHASNVEIAIPSGDGRAMVIAAPADIGQLDVQTSNADAWLQTQLQELRRSREGWIFYRCVISSRQRGERFKGRLPLDIISQRSRETLGRMISNLS